MTLTDAAALEALSAKGWHIKIRSYNNAAQPQWLVSLGWRNGPLPHKEENALADNLRDAAEWIQKTAREWKHGE